MRGLRSLLLLPMLMLEIGQSEDVYAYLALQQGSQTVQGPDPSPVHRALGQTQGAGQLPLWPVALLLQVGEAPCPGHAHCWPFGDLMTPAGLHTTVLRSLNTALHATTTCINLSGNRFIA